MAGGRPPAHLFMPLMFTGPFERQLVVVAMNADGVNPAQHGLGAGILFAGFLADPRFYLLQRIGMRADRLLRAAAGPSATCWA